jgi:hypothetical protein
LWRGLCVAYGNGITAAHQQVAFTERWTGSSWRAARVPAVAGSGATSVGAVTCVGSRNCFLVGDSGDRTGQQLTLGEHWQHSRWKLEHMPNTSIGGELDGVSCPSATVCTAVGSVPGNAARGSMPGGTLAERWENGKWAIEDAPDTRPIAMQASSLSAVSCPSSTVCVAVGSFAESLRTLAETWDGSKWTVTNTPRLPSGSTMNSVACVSAVGCLAVASNNQAEWWDGTRWSRTSGGGGVSVSCVSQASCVAVGGAARTAQWWDGSTWSVANTLPLTQTDYSLSDVSCTSSSSCLAVGSSDSGNGALIVLAVGWNGTSWTFQDVPAPSGATVSALNGISCTSSTACTAVGAYALTGSSPNLPLIEDWDGSNWTLANAPDPPGAITSILKSVSCPLPTVCTATGVADGRPLAEHSS